MQMEIISVITNPMAIPVGKPNNPRTKIFFFIFHLITLTVV